MPKLSRSRAAAHRRPAATRLLRRLPVGALGAAAAVALMGAAPATSFADPCAPLVNAVACENSHPGADPDTWEINGAGDEDLQGFATSMSVNKGSSISFKIKSDSNAFHIDILRLGYYGGDGARVWASSIPHSGPINQPACKTYSGTGLIDCGNWSTTATWTVPSTAVSGVYIANLVRNDDSNASHITFVVRDDASHSQALLSTSDATWEAYNTYGGNSLYTCTVACPDGNPAAYLGASKVSYNRPLHVAEDDGGRSALFTGAEYSMIRFLEQNGYDLSYTSSSDVADRAPLLLNHKVFISSGHDEYWSASQRSSVTAARDAGVNIAFFSGNEMFWKTRWEPSADGTTQNRTLVAYKDTHYDARVDPVSWTGTWRDPRFTTPAEGVTPENAVTGQSFITNFGTADITVPAEYGGLRLWRNTAAATLTAGHSLTLAPNTLGYEWDADADNGFRPAGSIRLSSTTVSGLDLFTDYGSQTSGGVGTATHNMTLYRAPSGAKVFGAGTIQWAWGLSDWNPSETPPDRNMQQATVNLLADLSAKAGTLASNLTAASASTDTSAPVSTLSTPPSTVADGTKVTLSGTATDVGGGRVAGIEVSTDDGATWHPATTGTAAWTYTWIAHGYPSTRIRVRATDDSGNTQTPGAGALVNITCPCSVWGPNFTPGAPDSGDPTPVEVGVKFSSDRFGTVSGLRFYKSSANTGTHIGSLWTADGTRLAQATFSSESATGWQTVTFATPVEVQPNTTYVASYYAPNGHYAATAAYFYRAPAPGPNGGAVTDSPPLHLTQNSATVENGVFSYGSTSSFPTGSFGASNYWVDVLFTPAPAPGTVTGVTARAAGRTSVDVAWTAPSTGGTVTGYTITPYAGTTAKPATTISGSPPATATTITGLTTGTTYTFKVQATNPTGAGPLSAPSGSATPIGPVAPSSPSGVGSRPGSTSALVSWTAPTSDGDSAITGYTVTPYVGTTAQSPTTVSATARATTVIGLTNGTSYTFKVAAVNAVGTSAASAPSPATIPQATIFDFATPGSDDAGDSGSVEIGAKFRADANGTVTGIRFYKAAANTGTHIGSLWSATGTRLAQVTFTGETASGWQSATFSTPVAVTAGTTYVASYFAPSGHYSATGGGLSTAVDNGPLHALASSASANGVYAYGTSSAFPTNTYNDANYWVDVLYALPAPGTPTAVVASNPGKTSADVAWTAPGTGGAPTAYKITPYIGATAQTATTVTGSPLPTSKTLSGLTTNTTYTFKVQAINGSGGGPLSAASNAVALSSTSLPPAPGGVVARPASGSALVGWTAPTADDPLTGYTVTPYQGATAQAATQVGPSVTSTTIGGLTNGSSYTFKVAARNANGTGAAATSPAVIPRATIFDFGTPGTPDSQDGSSVVLGSKFTSDVDGSVTGVRFFKSEANTGTHVGALWTLSGTLLAQTTFSGESASGWQSALFSSPVPITAGTTYVVSYLSPNGHYAANAWAFETSPIDNPPLHALSDEVSPNGLYVYSASGATFPSNSFNATNYWVDVLFAQGS